MPFNITNRQFQTALQTVQNRFIRIELLNYQFQVVEELNGVVTNGSITIDANADMRRTGSITLVVKDSSFEVGSGSKIWLDKYIRIYVDIDSVHSGVREPTNCGLFIIDAPQYQYDLATNTLTLSLLDLMAKLTGIRNGYQQGIPTRIEAGENIRRAIIATLALGGFDKYVVEEAPAPSVVPSVMEFDGGATLYDILSQLKDIYPNYEMYFDVDGTFYYKPIPTGQYDPVVIDDTTWNNIVLSESLNTDFQNVKNSIAVYGRTHSPQYFSATTTISNNVIELNIEAVQSYEDYIIYGFVLNDVNDTNGIVIKINNLPVIEAVNDDGTPFNLRAEIGENYYCIQYINGKFRWLGHLQAYGFAEDTNPESPFNVNGTVGRIRLPLIGGEYENCITDDLAQQRAEYELWLHTNMNNSVSLQCVPVPWIDVNLLVEYTLKRNDITSQYLIKTINLGLGVTDTMTIEMIQFYPENFNI